jgi:hypothetical protein
VTHTPQIGQRVRAVHFGPSKVIDDNLTVPPGTLGTVDHIDDAGTIFVQWDNGSGIGLVPEHDRWEVVEPSKRLTLAARRREQVVRLQRRRKELQERLSQIEAELAELNEKYPD